MPCAIGLVDANNFFASTEAALDPQLENRVVVVLSNNDACIVARSPAAKKLVPMGSPIFEVRALLEKHNAVILSSNYALYDEMSFRFQSLIEDFTPDYESYSIDESFVLMPLQYNRSLTEVGHDMREYIRALSGIPVSISFASTKTLSKIGIELAKTSERAKGVVNLYQSPHIEIALSKIKCSDVWGIGSQRAALLERNGIHTALDLRNADENWIRRTMTVTGLRTLQELRGIQCFPFEPVPKVKKQLCVSRSFGEATDDLKELKAAIAYFTARASEKLRDGGLIAGKLSVFIETDRFKDLPQYSNNISLTIAPMSDDIRELTSLSLAGLMRIYLPGYAIRRAGVILNNLVPRDTATRGLWGEDRFEKNKHLMAAIDFINGKYGADAIRCGMFPNRGKWKTKFAHRSPAYLSDWREIMTTM